MNIRTGYFFLVLAALLLVSCGGGGGGGGLSPPSALKYPTPPPFIQNHEIATLHPMVTGTVTAYSVSPSLPAGLSLDAVTGNISGTPTTVTPAAVYTIAAANSAGSTSTSLTLTVNYNRPVISYGSSTYGSGNLVLLTLNAPTDVAPTNTGGVATTWSISPALPAGLRFSTTDGSITGTPTTLMSPVSYVVTAQNATGSATADFALAIQQLLVDLGHSVGVGLIAVSTTRVLSMDGGGHWVLWDYGSGARIATGDVPCGPNPCDGMTFPTLNAEMAGETVAIQYPTGLEVRSSADGSLLGTLATQPHAWHLASDGSYVCSFTASGLTVWSLAGAVIVSRQGDYSSAAAVCVAGEVRIALGPSGANVIETVALPGGSSAVGPPFQGVFSSWFLDGGKFVTHVNNTVWVYSNASAQLDFRVLPTVSFLTGQGAWIWTFDRTSGVLNIYRVGTSGSAAASYTFASFNTAVHGSGLMIGAFEYALTAPQAHIIDLSGPAPSRADSPAGIIDGQSYAALSSSQWLAGNASGVLVDGPSLAGIPRYFDYGAALAIAGSSTRVAVATASGRTLLFSTTDWSLEGTLSGFNAQLALSSDGSVLAARSSGLSDSGQQVPQTVSTYSLPSGALINAWDYTNGGTHPFPLDISLSASGTALSQVIAIDGGYSKQVTSASGGPVLWSDTQAFNPDVPWQPVRLSPDGTLIAASSSMDQSAGTSVYHNGTLVTAVPGWAVNWLSDNSLLLQTFSQSGYAGSTIYDASGLKLSTPPLPQLSRPTQIAGPDSIYEFGVNQIFSLTSGTATWIGPRGSLFSSDTIGAVAESRVAFAIGSQVVAQPY